MVLNAKGGAKMSIQPLSLMNSLAKRFSSVVLASRIAMMTQMLRLELRAMKYGLLLQYGLIKKNLTTEREH